MDPTQVPDIAGLMSYGAMGICLAYFMVKDWVKSTAINKALQDNAIAFNQFASAIDMCNRINTKA
jgi:hypothetical protein